MKLTIGLMMLLLVAAMTARTAEHYVAINGAHISPYTNWPNAATNVIDAVNAASANETIWMSNGVFNLTNRLVIDNAKALRSVNGRDRTIINGLADSWGATATTGNHVYLAGGTFDGITLSNGYGIMGIEANKSSGGINCDGGSIVNSKFTHCTVGGALPSNGGGGITMYAGLMTNCIIQNCYAGNAGGGVYMVCQSGAWGSHNPAMKNCIIQNNLNVNSGGGLAIISFGGIALAENCIIRNNTNAAGSGGGGVWMYNGGLIRNCLVVSNYTAVTGGGIRMDGVKFNSPDDGVVNCTIADNVASCCGGGISIMDANKADAVINCIVYSNSAHSLPDDVSFSDPVSTNAVLYCCLSESVPSDRNSITSNPVFVNCAGGNYRPGSNSPCINTGINQNWMTNACDLDGKARVLNGKVDMGAYETF